MESNTKWIVTTFIALVVAFATMVTLIQNDQKYRSDKESDSTKIAIEITRLGYEAAALGLRRNDIDAVATQYAISAQQTQKAPLIGEPDYAPTAISLALESAAIASTRSYYDEQMQYLNATQTAFAQPPPTIAVTTNFVKTNIAEGSVPGVPETRMKLKLSADQLVMGTADKFQDSLDQNLPPFAVFVIYGPIDADITLPWGGWDQWRNATDSFVESELLKKIEQTKDNHPSDWRTRGIRVYRCHGSMENCSIEMYN